MDTATKELDDKQIEEGSSPSSDDTADSSTAKQDDKTLDQIAQDVIKRHSVEEEPDSSTEEEELSKDTEKEEPGEETEAQERKDEDDEEKKDESPDAKLPFNDHPRWKEVLSERNTLKQEREQEKPLVETARALSQFCQTNAISDEDLRNGLELIALSKKDVKGFRDKMNSYLENIDIALGSKLPADLQKDVDDGALSEVRAKELAQLRVRSQSNESAGKTSAQRAEESRIQSIEQGLNTWEDAQRKLDPEWDKRRDMLAERMQAIMLREPPRTLQDAIRIAEQANTEVKGRISKFIPKPPKRKPLTSTGSSTNSGSDFKLDSLDDLGDLVKQVAAKHR